MEECTVQPAMRLVRILLGCAEAIKQSEENIPVDYLTQTRVHSTWQCSLLRVWIQLFGDEETRRQADEILEDGLSFWERVSKEMKDEELLHIAVEIGSLIGVKCTAWPNMVRLRDGNNRTAVEYAEEKLGKGHDVTEYLGWVVGNLNGSGFFGS